MIKDASVGFLVLLEPNQHKGLAILRDHRDLQLFKVSGVNVNMCIPLLIWGLGVRYKLGHLG